MNESQPEHDHKLKRHEHLKHTYEILTQLVMHEGRFISERTNNFLLFNSILFTGFLILANQISDTNIYFIVLKIAIPIVGLMMSVLHSVTVSGTINAADFWRSSIGLIETDLDYWYPEKIEQDNDLDIFSARGRSLDKIQTRQRQNALRLSQPPNFLKRLSSYLPGPNRIFVIWLPFLIFMLWLLALLWSWTLSKDLNIWIVLGQVYLNEFVIAILLLILASIFIALLIIVKYVRRPSLEFLLDKGEPTPEDNRQGSMWYHLKVRNKEPPRFFNRDAALQCIARIDFVDKNTKTQLVPQITAHWVSQPKPRDYSTGEFDPSKIPACQRTDVGFKEEMFNILIKFEGESICFATNPWVVYRYQKGETEWEKLKIDVNEFIVKVELEAINLGKKKRAEYLLKNNGMKKEDIEIILLEK